MNAACQYLCYLNDQPTTMKTLDDWCDRLPVLAWVRARAVVAQNASPAVVRAATKTGDRSRGSRSSKRGWQAFSTSEGLMTWLAPDAVVDLRPGGEWTVPFSGGKHRRRNDSQLRPGEGDGDRRAGPGQVSPCAGRADARFVFEFEPHGNSTIVRLTQTGWKEAATNGHAPMNICWPATRS